MSKTVCIVQARTSSTRLPSKVLLELGDKPVLGHVLDRAIAIPGVDEVVVATSTDPSDDAIERYMRTQGFFCFRGSLTNVLDRYVEAARLTQAAVIVRVTADCPFLVPSIAGQVVRMIDGPIAYASNCVPRTFPDGLDCEAFSMYALTDAVRHATTPSDLEHVTPYMRRTMPFQATLMTQPDRSHLRWTLDTEEDWHDLRWLWERASALSPRERLFSYQTLLLADAQRRPRGDGREGRERRRRSLESTESP